MPRYFEAMISILGKINKLNMCLDNKILCHKWHSNWM